MPDSFEQHVKLMFDLQAVRLRGHDARVRVQDGPRCVEPRYPESGYKAAFHSASHHQDRDERVTEFAKISYHVSMVPYFTAEEHADGGSNLLENTLVLYGSLMGNLNVHNHKAAAILAGYAGGALKGGLHIRAADGTPMANAMQRSPTHAARHRCSATARQDGLEHGAGHDRRSGVDTCVSSRLLVWLRWR